LSSYIVRLVFLSESLSQDEQGYAMELATKDDEAILVRIYESVRMTMTRVRSD
jgi:hypothetical protein